MGPYVEDNVHEAACATSAVNFTVSVECIETLLGDATKFVSFGSAPLAKAEPAIGSIKVVTTTSPARAAPLKYRVRVRCWPGATVASPPSVPKKLRKP